MLSRWRSPLALALFALCAAPLLAHALLAGATPERLALWNTLALQAWWCGLAGFAALALGGAPRERLGLVRGRLGVASLLACAVGTLALSGALNFALEQFALRAQGSLARLDAIVQAAAPQSPWLTLFAFGIAPGVAEEFFFRGFLQRALAARIGAWSIIAAAAAFGLLHQDPVHSPAAFVLGCYLGAVAWSARSTWAAVLCHVANNSAATLQQLGVGPAFPAPGSWLGAAAWLAASGLILTAVALAAAHSSPRARDSSD